MGCPLIQQDGGKVILTNYGELLAKHCAIIQEDVKRIYADLEQARSEEALALHINVAPSIRLLLPFNTSDEVRKANPDVHLYEGNLLDVEAEEMLLAGKCDAIIGLGPISDPKLTAVSLFSYPACAVMRRSHPLARKEVLTLEELCKQPLVIVDEKYKTIPLLTQACTRQNLTPNIVMRSPSSTILYCLCFEHDYLGLTFCTEEKHIYDNDYSHVPIKLSDFCFQGFLVSASSQSRSEVLNRYLCFIQEYPFKEKLAQLQLPGIPQIML